MLWLTLLGPPAVVLLVVRNDRLPKMVHWLAGGLWEVITVVTVWNPPSKCWLGFFWNFQPVCKSSSGGKGCTRWMVYTLWCITTKLDRTCRRVEFNHYFPFKNVVNSFKCFIWTAAEALSWKNILWEQLENVTREENFTESALILDLKSTPCAYWTTTLSDC